MTQRYSVCGINGVIQNAHLQHGLEPEGQTGIDINEATVCIRTDHAT